MELGKGLIADGLRLAVKGCALDVKISDVDKDNHFAFNGKTDAKEILTALNELKGDNKTPQEELQENLDLVVSVVNAVESKDAKLQSILFKLNSTLLSLTFLAGNNESVIDFFVMPAVGSEMKSWTPKQQGISCNLTRWFNNMQHLDVLQDNEKLSLIQDKPPPEKKPKKAGADGGEKKADKKKPDDKKKSDDNDTNNAEGKKEKKVKQAKPAAEAAPVDVSRCSFIVGKIVDVEKHPNADSLYIEKIDCGEESGPRTIVSGLVKFVDIKDMKDRMVIVFSNLKPSNLKSVKSYGMVMCGSNAEHTKVELLTPPEGSKIGERLTCEGYDGEPDKQIDMKKKSCPWPEIQPDLRVNANGEASYKGVVLKSSTGVITVPTLKDVIIS